MEPSGILDQVTLQFLQTLQQDGIILQGIAKKVFYYLALIQLTITALWLSLTGQSLQLFFTRMLQTVLGFSILYACIDLGSQWIPLVLNGFIEIGQKSGIHSLSPSSILDQGLSIAGSILKTFFSWGGLTHPFVAIIGAINCISIVIIYALIAAELTIVLVKSYVLTALSSFFFALGASEVTRPMTLSYLKTVIGIGLKLMTLYFLIGVSQNLGQHWEELSKNAADSYQILPMLAILAAVILYYLVIRNVPSFIAGLAGVGGFRNEGDAAVAMTLYAVSQGSKKAFSIGSKVAQGGNQTVQAVTKAVNIAKTTAGVSGVGAVATVATDALAKATFNSIKDGVNKKMNNQSFGQRVNHHLNKQQESNDEGK